MFSKFLNLEKEKQDRIINAALKEFSQKGYDNASTNVIVREAGISKGLLFHYFKNKKQLFLFLYDYCVELTVGELFSKIDLEEKDFFIRLRQVLTVKMGLLKKYPEMIKFFEVAFIDNSSEIKDDLNNKNKEIMASSYSRVFENIDMSKFKENMDIKKVINIITWTFEGISNSEIAKIKLSSSKQIDYDKSFAEADIYIEMLKNWFYK